MSENAFTPEQRAELAHLIEQAVADAVQPIAAQTTRWIEHERARLTDPRRPATGAPVARRPGRLVPDHPRNAPPIGDPTTPATPTSGVRE